jgi:hypothetical protein
MRSNVDFPAPFGPTIATASPGVTEKETPARAHSVGRVMGWSKARQPDWAGGKNFWSEETAIASAGICVVITEVTEAIQFRRCFMVQSR